MRDVTPLLHNTMAGRCVITLVQAQVLRSILPGPWSLNDYRLDGLPQQQIVIYIGWGHDHR